MICLQCSVYVVENQVGFVRLHKLSQIKKKKLSRAEIRNQNHFQSQHDESLGFPHRWVRERARHCAWKWNLLCAVWAALSRKTSLTSSLSHLHLTMNSHPCHAAKCYVQVFLFFLQGRGWGLAHGSNVRGGGMGGGKRGRINFALFPWTSSHLNILDILLAGETPGDSDGKGMPQWHLISTPCLDIIRKAIKYQCQELGHLPPISTSSTSPW